MTVRVVFITPSLTLGGAERSLVKAATVIARAGVQVDVLILTVGPNTLVSELPDSVGVLRCNGTRTANPWLWFRVGRMLRRMRPDVVVAWSVYANLVAVIASGLRRPWKLVLSERIYLPEMMRSPEVSWYRRWIVLFLMKAVYRHADIVTANSHDSVRFLQKFIGGTPRYLLLPNMIALTQVAEASRWHFVDRQPRVGPHLLALGRLERQKGFDILLEALALIRTKHNWSLVIVGEGAEKQSFQRLADRLGVTDAVHWVGAVSNPYPYYLWADLVVVPSRFEGFPNVLLEAMACGRATIAADCKTGPRELTGNGLYGVLVPVNDVAALAQGIVELANDVDRRRLLGHAAREHVRKVYDIDVVAQMYLDLVQRKS